MTLRIYADFNGLVGGVQNPERKAVVLDTFGSVRDLSNAGVVLTPGLQLIAVDASDDDEDLEGHGVALYDWDQRWWVVEFDALGVRSVPAGDRSPVREFRCVSRRRDLQPLLDDGQLEITGSCPSCATSLGAVIRAPTSYRQ